jgi:hypothetical protein
VREVTDIAKRNEIRTEAGVNRFRIEQQLQSLDSTVRQLKAEIETLKSGATALSARITTLESA